MHFILAPGHISKFDNLRKDYETKKKVDLDATPPMIGLPTLFGGTDVISRKNQIAFLEKIYAALKLHLVKEEQINTEMDRQVYIIAARVLMAACLYVQYQIGKSAVLYKIIEDYLGITPENTLDAEDREVFFLTAKRIINTPNEFELINVMLKKKTMDPFTEKEWHQFSNFLEEMCHKNDSKDKFMSFPVISITKPLFGAAFSYVGATVGVVMAEGVSNSTSAVSPRVQLTALVGSTVLILSPSGTTGAALLAPMIATNLISSFCRISLAHIMGVTARIIGQGVGIGVGLPFDVAYNLLWNLCATINRYYSKITPLAAIDGIRLLDGATIIAGIPIQVMSEQELPKDCTRKKFSITDKGELLLEDESESHSKLENSSNVLEELKKQAQLHALPQEKVTLTKEADAEELTEDTQSVMGL